MTEGQRIDVINALTENVMATVGDFQITTFHSFFDAHDRTEGYWDIILKPTDKHIFFLSAIMRVIDDLDFDLDVHTDVARPGCIILH